MGSGPWRRTVVTTALTLVASILPWCAVALPAAENYEGSVLNALEPVFWPEDIDGHQSRYHVP